MELGALSIEQLAALLGAVGAATVVLYLLRPRRPVVRVPFVALWDAALGEPAATRWWAGVRRWLSLLLALVIAAALCVAFADPRPALGSTAVRHTLVLIDAGLSMQATDVEPTRAVAAVEAARQLVSEAGPQHRFMIAQLDARARPLGPMSTERIELDTALERLSPTDLATDPVAGYRLALEVLRGLARPRLLVISDRLPPPDEAMARKLEQVGIAIDLRRVGEASSNLALSALAVRRYPLDKNRSELWLQVDNAADEPARAELTLLADDAAIEVEEVEVPAGGSVRRTYENLGGAARVIEGRVRSLGARDHLPADDRAFATVPERHRARVLCVTAGNRYLEAALLLDEYLEVDIATEPNADVAAYDVVIFDGIMPAKPPAADAIYLGVGAANGYSPVTAGDAIERPFFDELAADHPVLRWTVLGDVNIASATPLSPAEGDVVLGADARGALLVAGKRDAHAFVALAFDPRQSDLPLRIAWPLLLLNAIDWFRGEGSDYVPGHEVARPITVATRADQVSVTEKSGIERTLHARDGRVTFSTPRAGVVRVRGADGERLLAVNRAPHTPAAIAPAAGTHIDSTSEIVEPPPVPRTWMWLVLVAALLLTIEWLTYNRRWTV